MFELCLERAAYWLSLMDKPLCYLAMAGHSDFLIIFCRFTDEPCRPFAITRKGAIHQHHCMEATYLCLFETVGHWFSLVQRDLKMIFGRVPVMCCCCSHSRYCMCKTE